MTGIPPPVDWMNYLCISPISGSVVIILSSPGTHTGLSTLLHKVSKVHVGSPPARRSCHRLIENSSDYLRSKTVPNCIQVQILSSFSVESSFNNRNRGKCRNNRTGIKPDSCNSPAPVKDIFGPTHLLTNAVMQFVHSIE